MFFSQYFPEATLVALWERGMQWYTTNMQLCKGIHTLCQSDCSHAIFFLMRLCLTLGLEDRRSYKIRLRQGQPTHQELCKEVWSQCQSKSYLLDTGRKVAVCGGACVCVFPLKCVQTFVWYVLSEQQHAQQLFSTYYILLVPVSLTGWLSVTREVFNPTAHDGLQTGKKWQTNHSLDSTNVCWFNLSSSIRNLELGVGTVVRLQRWCLL